MIKFNELKKGCFVNANFDGDIKTGEIDDIKNAEKQVEVVIGESEYWFSPEELTSIEITDEVLSNLKFTKQQNEDGNIKYMKGAFRMLVPKESDFSRMEIWYRDEQRHIIETIPLHVLQNHFFEMTKVHLNEGEF